MREKTPFGVTRAPGTVNAALNNSSSADRQTVSRSRTGQEYRTRKGTRKLLTDLPARPLAIKWSHWIAPLLSPRIGFWRGRSSRRRAYRYEDGRPFVLNQKHNELCRFRFACVTTNGMNVVGPLIKSLTRRKRDFFPAFHLHDNRAFQHVNERMRVVPMNRIRSARWIHYGDHQTFLAGKARKIFRHERRNLSILRDQGAGGEKQQRRHGSQALYSIHNLHCSQLLHSTLLSIRQD